MGRRYGACVFVLAVLASAACAQGPKQIVATWTDRAPAIDGKLDDPAWASAKEIGGFVIISTAKTKPDAPTYVKVITDGKALFVGFRCVEPKMSRLKAEKRDPDTQVWLDDSVEVILDTANDRRQIYHLIANALGCRYDEIRVTARQGDDPSWNGDWEVATSKGAGEWYAEWKIPFKTVGISLDRNLCVGMTLARARLGAKAEESCLPAGYRIFANPDYLGTLVLPSKDGACCSLDLPSPIQGYRGTQNIALAVANHAGSPVEARYTYRLSGAKEVWGRSDPFTLAAHEGRSISLPVVLPEAGEYRLSVALEEAGSGTNLGAATRRLEANPDIRLAESLYDLYRKKAVAEIELSMPPEKLRGAVMDVALVKAGPDAPVMTQKLRPPFAKPVRVAFDLTQQPKGTYSISATIRSGGEVLASIESRPMPYNPNPKIGFDKNGFLSVEGKPYFPVGIYTIQSRGTDHDAVLEEARQAGFNTTVFYAYSVPTITPLLDAAARHGIKAFVYPTIPFSVRTSTVTNEDVVKDVVARRDHPALLGWYLVDEPEGIGKAGANPVRDLYQTVKETDTDHPCSLVIMSPRAAGEYQSCADVIWIDPYPVPSTPVTYVSTCTGGAVSEVGDKPVWTIPQAFDWSVWRTGKVDKVHRPTPEEERCMTYLALVHGAKGIIYWAHTGSRYYIEDYPEHWAAVKKIAGELRDLSPVLLTLDSKRKIQLSPKDATIDIMVKELDGRTYVFAVNREPEPCGAGFLLSGTAADSKLDVLFENRAIQAKNGGWKDDFKPLEVHVYRLSAR